MSVTTEANPDLIADLAQRFEVWEPEIVRPFLAANPDILASLDDIAMHIGQYFRLHRPLILQVPDDGQDGGRDELYVLIPTKLAPEVALEARNRMYREWWVEAANQWDVRVNVDVRFL